MEIGMNDKLHHLEEALNRLSNVLLANLESSNHGNHHRENQDGGQQIVSSKSAKLEFPRFSGDDPTEWFNRVEQFFEYQGTTTNQKEEGHIISWEKFENELWARFRPSGCEDSDEALSRIRQLGTLRDYQHEFEKLGNKLLLLEGHASNVIYEDITDQQTLEEDHGGDVAEVQKPERKPEITLHALTGWTAPKTMRVTVKMGPHEVMVLIDSGSTHNFINNCLASMLRLPVIPTETFPVGVAN
ncbi:hypothetical protein Pint_26749 [Pistacia integerrima]|uniref:Uncharacterized protein n=1 Tax=Pistacia integerrima TaxID=434235 RepID=A0ACC0YQD5_9ROSI|nr:hypothetical protein Pint_26749 [Pistacia integerrima]